MAEQTDFHNEMVQLRCKSAILKQNAPPGIFSKKVVNIFFLRVQNMKNFIQFYTYDVQCNNKNLFRFINNLNVNWASDVHISRINHWNSQTTANFFL